MPTLASVTELADHLGVGIAPSDERATRLLESASTLVRAEAGQQTITAVTGDTVTLRGRGEAELALPQVPVTAVNSVTVDGTALAADDYNWWRVGLLVRTTGDWDGTVTVVYDHGYPAGDPGLDLAREICLSTAARMWDQPNAGIAQESVGSYAVTYSRSSDTGGLLRDEAELVRRRYGRGQPASIPVGTMVG